MESGRRLQLTEQAVYVGLAANALLAVAKVVVGTTQSSQALLADGINSTLDTFYFVATLYLVRLAAKGPDYEHPQGHGQTESIASILIGAFIITTAAAIFYDSLSAFFAGARAGGSWITLLVAASTIATKSLLVTYTRRIASATRNTAVEALAVDHANDIYVSATVFVGVAAAALGYPRLDPLAGAAVSVFVLRSGLGVIRGAAEDLMGSLPHAELASRVRALAGRVRGVASVDEVRAQRFGPYLMLQVEISVDPAITVAEGHAVAEAVEESLLRGIPEVRRAYIHVNPAA